MEMDEAGVLGRAAPVGSGANGGTIARKLRDSAHVVPRENMEVFEGSIARQGRSTAAVASGVVMEQGAGGLQVEEEVGECLVGRYIGRRAPGHGTILIGKVASYDSTTGIFGVVFEDGHGEDLGLPKLQEFLIPEENGTLGMDVSCRKRKLDLLIAKGSALDARKPGSTRQRVDGCVMSTVPDAPQQSVSGSDMPDDIEPLSESSDFSKEQSEPCPPVQAVELPPSSGDIDVPEESITYLFAVYNFLRSFSVQLFLSPFGLDDFVAAINCTVQNNLLDAVHVSLLRALRRHLESKSTKLVSNCFKYLDWTLIDTLTWPAFLLEYLYVMCCIKNLGARSFGRNLVATEYYKLPVAMKLRVLQILCDHVIDSEELKTELEGREGYNEEMEYETDPCIFFGPASSAVSARASKAFAYKRTGDLQSLERAPNVNNPKASVENASQDGNSNNCRICGMSGTLLCCDGCPWAYHSRCIGQSKAFLPQGAWFCHECVVNKLGPTSARVERGATGAQMFGIDMCGRIFLGSCNYLLMIQMSSNAESHARYYNHHDVVKVLEILALSDAYIDICRQIKEYMSGGYTAAKLSSFKPQAYMNLYHHGNIAACAAANLAAITADQDKVSSSQVTTNFRKKIAADNALQVKVFSSASTQFVWPSAEKKLMEIPRDRCGWCLACRCSAIGNKKACFLNMAAANAVKSSARVLSFMHVIENSDSHFPSIVAYLANMEESLRGLLASSLQDARQRQRWHQQLREASNCRTVIPLLLELESNIRGVAFSESWLKPIDDWPGVSVGASCPAAYQKHRTGGRRHKLAYESGTTIDADNSWIWWSGGNISKRILHRGSLQRLSIRKAARQGGKKRIAGLSYHEGSNFPRQSQQFAWRACVELSQNSSQFALQVRCLDAHIRWKELIPPDQIPSDGASSNDDFSALRNAVVCDKKIIDNKIRYALKFPNQKHLPVHVTTNILEAEGNHNENSKLWFSENHVPLYMLREFELKAGISALPNPGISDSNCFTNFLTTQVKAYTGNVFSYLFHKGDVYPCTSCKKDVLFRDVVKCSSCQGSCHKECTTRSVSGKGGSAISNLICKLCLQKRNLRLTSYHTNASYTRPQQMMNGQQPVTASKIIFTVGSSHSAEPALKVGAQPVSKVSQPFAKVTNQPIVNVKAQPPAKLATLPITNVAAQNITCVQAQPKSKKSNSVKAKRPKHLQVITYFGLVWKKNKNDKDNRKDFTANDVILQSRDGISSSMRPTCCLCKKAYSPDFLYIRCERCRSWFHGDALQLDEEKISELVAYICCRCRRRTVPLCPHSADYKDPEPDFIEQTAVTSSQSTMPEDQDPLLSSHGTIEPIGEETWHAGLSRNVSSFHPRSNQKLSIRRA
ncbi:unnamed protein product [Urochloa decumbens]|uniref:DDT domain-containing protein PTM n=1 Tax=Urochloa decumbens TaxID=240449 RepID=A0ABC8Y1F9_9POAL